MVALCSTSLEESLKDLFQVLMVKWGTVKQGLRTAFMPLHPDKRCCAVSLLILLPPLSSFQDRLHPSEPKQNKPTPLNGLFPGIWSQQGRSNLTNSPRVLCHNESIQEAKKSQEFVLCPLSPCLLCFSSLLHPYSSLCLQGLCIPNHSGERRPHTFLLPGTFSATSCRSTISLGPWGVGR